MDDNLQREIFERVAKMEGQMSQFLIAAANMMEANEKLSTRVTAIELMLAQIRGGSTVATRALDIVLSVAMAFVGAFAYKMMGAG